MGISSDRAYRIQAKALAHLQDAYSGAIACRVTHDELFNRTQAVYQTPEVKKAPYYVRAYLQGYEKARRDDLYRSHYVWMLWLDGRLVDASEVEATTEREKASGESSCEGYRSPWSRIDGDRSRHVWRMLDPVTREPVAGRVGDPTKPA